MHLSRRQSVVLACLTLVLFFAGGTALLRRHPEEPRPELPAVPTPAPAETGGESSTLTLGEFHRSETRDGRKLWEVKAESGQYFPEEKKAVLRRAMLWFYRKEGEVVTLQANEAELMFDQMALTKASLTKDVRVNMNDKLRLTTEEAHFDNQAHTVFAPGLVTIINEKMQIAGEELHAQVDTREFTLARNVTTMIAAKEEEKNQ